MPRQINLVGKTFNEWTVLSYAGKQLWNCRCSCSTERQVDGSSLKRGKSKSCGHDKNQLKDLTGQMFGEWTVLEYVGDYKWLCRCSCNTIKEVDGRSLRNGTSTSCGHTQNKNNIIDLTGQTFGEWTVISYAGESYWNCKCSCGNEKQVHSQLLREHKSKSCGHEKRLAQQERFIGKTFGNWTVLSYVGNQYWNCKCECGLEQEVYISNLRKARNCTHIHSPLLIDLTGQTIGDWTVIDYAGQGRWNCKCVCGAEEQVSSHTLRNLKSQTCTHKNKPKISEGQVIGDWTVIKNLGYGYWKCKCSCNNEKIVKEQHLIEKRSLSCGHDKLIDLTGQTFGDWTVISYAGNQYWNCRCSCGVEKQVYGQSLREHKSTNCGHVHNSKEQNELAQYIKSLTEQSIQENNYELLDGLELDVYLPNLRLAFEYNGTYWHSTINKPNKNYHLNKVLLCNKNNINLVHIYDYEWKNVIQQEKLKNLIKQQLNINQKIIYARNTIIKYVNELELYKFLETYHLQGNTPCNIALGLYYNNELVQVMTFGKPRFNREYDTELLRLCTKSNYKIIGGASKLFKHYIKEYSTESIVSYCDISKFTGKVYEQIGMTFDGFTDPSYVYVSHNLHEVYSRYQCMKHKLIEKGWGTEEQTEEEIMRSHDYFKIYNCGNKRFVYKPN